MAPFVLARRSLLTRNRSLWSAQVRCTAVTGTNDGVVADASPQTEGKEVAMMPLVRCAILRLAAIVARAVGIGGFSKQAVVSPLCRDANLL